MPAHVCVCASVCEQPRYMRCLGRDAEHTHMCARANKECEFTEYLHKFKILFVDSQTQEILVLMYIYTFICVCCSASAGCVKQK